MKVATIIKPLLFVPWRFKHVSVENTVFGDDESPAFTTCKNFMIHRIDHNKGKPDGWAGLAYMTAVVILAKVSSTYWKPNKPLTSTSVIGGKKIALILKPLLFHFFWVHPNVQHNQVEPPKNCFTDFFSSPYFYYVPGTKGQEVQTRLGRNYSLWRWQIICSYKSFIIHFAKETESIDITWW